MDILTDRRSANDNIHNGVIICHLPLILKIGAGFPVKPCALTLGAQFTSGLEVLHQYSDLF